MLEYHKSQLTQIKLLLVMIILLLAISLIFINDLTNNSKENSSTMSIIENKIQDIHNIFYDKTQTSINN